MGEEGQQPKKNNFLIRPRSNYQKSTPSQEPGQQAQERPSSHQIDMQIQQLKQLYNKDAEDHSQPSEQLVDSLQISTGSPIKKRAVPHGSSRELGRDDGRSSGQEQGAEQRSLKQNVEYSPDIQLLNDKLKHQQGSDGSIFSSQAPVGRQRPSQQHKLVCLRQKQQPSGQASQGEKKQRQLTPEQVPQQKKHEYLRRKSSPSIQKKAHSKSPNSRNQGTAKEAPDKRKQQHSANQPADAKPGQPKSQSQQTEPGQSKIDPQQLADQIQDQAERASTDKDKASSGVLPEEARSRESRHSEAGQRQQERASEQPEQSEHAREHEHEREHEQQSEPEQQPDHEHEHE